MDSASMAKRTSPGMMAGTTRSAKSEPSTRKIAYEPGKTFGDTPSNVTRGPQHRAKADLVKRRW